MILVARCVEKSGEVVRQVRPLDRSDSNLLRVWLRLRSVRNCFEGKEDLILDKRLEILEVDDVGILVLENQKETVGGGRVHITFWDRRLRGREHLCRRIAEWWMEARGLDYLYTTVPKDFPAVSAFCKRVGFRDVQAEDGSVVLAIASRNYLHGAKSTGGT